LKHSGKSNNHDQCNLIKENYKIVHHTPHMVRYLPARLLVGKYLEYRDFGKSEELYLPKLDALRMSGLLVLSDYHVGSPCFHSMLKWAELWFKEVAKQ
jgi:hypothetical protein